MKQHTVHHLHEIISIEHILLFWSVREFDQTSLICPINFHKLNFPQPYQFRIETVGLHLDYNNCAVSTIVFTASCHLHSPHSTTLEHERSSIGFHDVFTKQ